MSDYKPRKCEVPENRPRLFPMNKSWFEMVADIMQDKLDVFDFKYIKEEDLRKVFDIITYNCRDFIHNVSTIMHKLDYYNTHTNSINNGELILLLIMFSKLIQGFKEDNVKEYWSKRFKKLVHDATCISHINGYVENLEKSAYDLDKTEE